MGEGSAPLSLAHTLFVNRDNLRASYLKHNGQLLVFDHEFGAYFSNRPDNHAAILLDACRAQTEVKSIPDKDLTKLRNLDQGHSIEYLIWDTFHSLEQVELLIPFPTASLFSLWRWPDYIEMTPTAADVRLAAFLARHKRSLEETMAETETSKTEALHLLMACHYLGYLSVDKSDFIHRKIHTLRSATASLFSSIRERLGAS